jgi:Flp pilus assembly protein TadG
MFVFAGMVAIVIDVSWYWVNSLRVQRAADAAALAGVVKLPADPTSAYALARAEAKKNGYDSTAPGITVTPQQFPATTGRRLNVTVSAPVNTFFMRIFGMPQIQATRTARAEFVLPVPMGSPENYYGVFGMTRGLTNTATTTTITPMTGNSGWVLPGANHIPTPPGPPAVWTASSGNLTNAVTSNDNVYARTTVNASSHDWSTFSLNGALGANDTLTAITGLEVRLSDAYFSASGCTGRVRVLLSWNSGAAWTTTVTETPNLGTNSSSGDYTLGSTSNMTAWGAHAWVPADISNLNFRLRLTGTKSGGGCAAATQLRVDMLEVRLHYNFNRATTTTTTTTLPDQLLQGPGTGCVVGAAGCFNADGAALNPRGFWATMNSQGSANVNGDAHQPYYDTVGGATNPMHDPNTYYNYAFEMPAGSTNGSIYLYDPVFCTTNINRGVGDRWFSGAGDAVSSFYRVYDTQGTIYDAGDDGAPVADSGSMFRNMSFSDTTMGGAAGGTTCQNTTDSAYGDARDYHNRWYLLASGLTGGPVGRTYRIHTNSTDPINATAQIGTDAENSFAIYGSATGGTPRVYGLGAMQAFTPLSASGSPVSSEFYLAQLDAVHAGKTVEISLWDPGDTNPLNAQLQILAPNSGGWSAVPVNYTAARGTTNANAAACDSLSGNNVMSITTNVGATAGTFNGCWLTILAQIPSGYTAAQNGWWKIRYTMNGSGTSNDVTTWKVNIRGNPVHLVIP